MELVEKDDVTSAMVSLQATINHLVAEKTYDTAAECIKAGKKVAQEYEEAINWNSYVRGLKRKLLGAHRAFWEGTIKGKLEYGLVTEEEDEAGNQMLQKRMRRSLRTPRRSESGSECCNDILKQNNHPCGLDRVKIAACDARLCAAGLQRAVPLWRCSAANEMQSTVMPAWRLCVACTLTGNMSHGGRLRNASSATLKPQRRETNRGISRAPEGYKTTAMQPRKALS